MKAIKKQDKRLLAEIIRFTIPLILTNILQQMYHIIDHMIAGNFAGDLALAAMGSTQHLTSLLTQLMIGLSVGVSAVVAQTIGENNETAIRKTAHTAIAMGIAGGLIISVIGVLVCKPLLILLNTPESILAQSTAYMRIIFGGYVTLAVYNFGAAVLRAEGNTKAPLYHLLISGFVKSLLTFFFVAVCKFGVRSMAVATIISQLISAVLVLRALGRGEGRYKLRFREIKIHGLEFRRIMRMGLPTGLQTSTFPISNVLIQSSINTFGELAIAGTAAAGHINSVLYAVLTSMSQSATIFCGRAFGARKLKQLLKSMYMCLGLVLVVGLSFGTLFQVFSREIIGLFVEDKSAIQYGAEMAASICLLYFFNGFQEVVGGGLRAINRSTEAMLSATFGLCIVRIVWIYTYFASHRSIGVLYYSYPLSWIVTLLTSSALFIVYFRKTVRLKKHHHA